MTALLFSFCSTDNTFTIYPKLPLHGKNVSYLQILMSLSVIYVVPITLLFKYLPFWCTMIYEKKGNFILQKSGINDSFDVYICDRMNFKGLYGIALVSLLHVSKWCYLRKVLTVPCYPLYPSASRRNTFIIFCRNLLSVLLKVISHCNKYFQVWYVRVFFMICTEFWCISEMQANFVSFGKLHCNLGFYIM